MKTLNLNEMERIEGGKPCTKAQVMVMTGAAVSLTILTGGLGAWIGVGLLYSCVLKGDITE